MSIGVLIRVSDNDKNKKKTETKIQRDLKELIDRHGSMFTSSATVEQDGNKNSLKSFFIDEMNLTKKTLNLIRVDVETLRFEDNVVTNFIKFSYQIYTIMILAI